MQLRDYQIEAIQSLDSAVDIGRKSQILSLATGGGKTICALEWLYDRYLSKNVPVLWVAHREELLSQAERTLRSHHPNVPISYWNAKEKNISKGLTLASVFSCKKFPKKHFGCLVVDEAHHQQAQSYLKLEQKIKFDFKLGLTACIERLDQKELDFEGIAYQKSLLELAKAGYLAMPRPYLLRTGRTFNMNRNKNDFTKLSLGQLDDKERNELIVNHYLVHYQDYGKTLAFMPNKKSAYALYKHFLDTAPHISAAILTDDASTTARKQTVSDIHADGYDFVINVEIFTEGFDWAPCQTIFMCRPTLSKSLLLQMVGRGSRLSPGAHSVAESAKKHFNIVFFIDEISNYPAIAEEWAINELDYKDKHAIERKKKKEDEEEIEKALEKEGLTKKDLAKTAKKYDRKLLDIAALGIYSSKFDYEKKVLLTPQDLHVLTMFEKYISEADNTYMAINKSWSIFAPMVELSQQEWTSLCWGWYYKKIKAKDTIKYEGKRKRISGRNGRTFHLIMLREPDSSCDPDGDLRRLVDEDQMLTDQVRSNGRAILNRTLSLMISRGEINRYFARKYLYKDFYSRTFSLVFDGERNQLYYYKNALESALSEEVGTKVSVKLEVKQHDMLDL